MNPSFIHSRSKQLGMYVYDSVVLYAYAVCLATVVMCCKVRHFSQVSKHLLPQNCVTQDTALHSVNTNQLLESMVFIVSTPQKSTR